MKRTDAKAVIDIIKEYLERDGIDVRFNEQRAVYLWPEIVGPGVNRYTTRSFVDKGVLHVYISSAALKNELSFMRPQIIEAINTAVGTPVITEISLH